jgi:hypothetical protein
MKKNLFGKNTFQTGTDRLTPEQNCSMINKLGNQNKTLRFLTLLQPGSREVKHPSYP